MTCHVSASWADSRGLRIFAGDHCKIVYIQAMAWMLPQVGGSHLHDRRTAVEHSQRHHAGRIVGVPVLLHFHLTGPRSETFV